VTIECFADRSLQEDCVIRMISEDQFTAYCILQKKRHHEQHELPEAVRLDRDQLAPPNR